MSIGTPGSGTRATMDLAMNALWLQAFRFEDAAELKFIEMPPALCDNKIDAFVFVAGYPNAILNDAANVVRDAHRAGRRPRRSTPDRRSPVLREDRHPGENVQGDRYRAAILRHGGDPRGQCRHAGRHRLRDHQGRVRELRTTSRSCIRRSPRLTKEGALPGDTVPFHPGAVKYFKEAGMR